MPTRNNMQRIVTLDRCKNCGASIRERIYGAQQVTARQQRDREVTVYECGTVVLGERYHSEVTRSEVYVGCGAGVEDMRPKSVTDPTAAGSAG
jgi:hypothetical protein